MKLTIKKSDLLQSLGHVQSVVEKRGTIDVISNVKLEASGSQLSLTATDMDIAIIENAQANIETEGATTVPAHTLYEIIRKLPDADITLIYENDQISIQAVSSHFKLACIDVKEFPVMSGDDLKFEFTLSNAELESLFAKTRFAISNDETRFFLNGVYFHVAGEDEKHLRAVATDGHRLGQVDVALPAGAEGMPSVIVPKKAVAELLKLASEYEDEVKISLSESKIKFSFEKATIISKIIDGKYPDYQRVIPVDNDKIMETSTKSLAEAVDRVSVISADKARGVKFNISNGSLVLSATSAENGSATEELTVGYSAEEFESGFNSKYLLEMLSQIDGEDIQFVFSSASKPALVRDTSDASSIYVVMPMRV